MARVPLLVLGALQIASVRGSPSPSRLQKPNILLIVSDDLGYGEVSAMPRFNGSSTPTIKTPNIDELFASGMRFDFMYTGQAVCAPSRYSLMTGYHQGHAYIRGNYPVNGHDLPMRAQDFTLPELLKENGYTTKLVGKWGMGWNDTTGAPWLKGFDSYFGQIDQSRCHDMYPAAPYWIWDQNSAIFLPENDNASRAYCMSPGNNCTFTHDLWTNKTMELLQEQAALGASAPPLYLELAYTDPHAGGWHLADESGNPVPSDGAFASETWPDVEKDHASVITNFQDRDIGRIMAELKSLGLLESTLVIFASDNGAHNEGGHDVHFFDSTGGLRGFKRSLYEGGIRTPGAVSWPGVIPAGTVSNYSWAFYDVLPTIADLIGVKVPPQPVPIDGVSVLDVWLGTGSPAHLPLYFEFCTNQAPWGHPHKNPTSTWAHAVINGTWKGVSFAPSEALELYNLAADPTESVDVAAKHPALVAAMEAFAKQQHTDSTLFPVQDCTSS